MTISRRTALSGIAALPVLAAVPAVAEGTPDTELLAKVARFEAIHREHRQIEQAHHALFKALEAEYPAPRLGDFSDDDAWRAAEVRRRAYARERGLDASSQRWNESGKIVREAVRDVFRTPATTAAGILAKLRIYRVAVGEFSRAEFGDEYDADDTLFYAQFHDWTDEDENGRMEPIGEDTDFLAIIIEDVARLTGRAAV